jgi:hypothetical protein
MASTAISLTDLPTEVLASVLGRYSRGRTLSTFLCVALGHRSTRQAAFAICRGALVQRYIELSQDKKLKESACYEESRDVLDIVREDIRLSNDDDDAIVTKFSEWCAILDYFEMQLEATAPPRFLSPQWIVWCGEMEIPYGRIRSYLTTPFWTVCGLHYWRNQELSQLSLTRPRHSNFNFVDGDDRVLYGTFFGMNAHDRTPLNLQCLDLEVHTLVDVSDRRRYCLVPLNQSYDDSSSFVVVDHSLVCRTHTDSLFVCPLLIDPGQQSLCCCWDKEVGEDLWEDAMSNFGQNAIRIMETLSNHPTSADDFRALHSLATEFGTIGDEPVFVRTGNNEIN